MENRKTILELGCKFTGVATETALELTTGGAFLGLLGKFAGAAVESVLNDFAERTLSHREQYRVGGSLFFASNKLQERIGNGDILRKDDRFFPNNENYRSSSEEILEGVITKSKIEHEELKIKYISYIFANAAFSQDNLQDINFYLKVAGDLTYRQLCLLAGIHNKNTDWRKKQLQHFSAEDIAIAQEFYDLSQKGIIEVEGIKELYDDFNSSEIEDREVEMVTSWHDIVPNRIALNKLGRKIYNIMDLKEISSFDIEKIIKIIKN